jgi:phosphoribosylformylglycinamidine (FGAM) synthase PurS component
VNAVAITLKIPDNAAYTALVALRRLGVRVERVERGEIWFFDDDEATALTARVEADETIFNPNKHRVSILECAAPRPGEVWIEPLERTVSKAPAAISWRLFGSRDVPVGRRELDAAIERLLCNPAIERPIVGEAKLDRDIRSSS